MRSANPVSVLAAVVLATVLMLSIPVVRAADPARVTSTAPSVAATVVPAAIPAATASDVTFTMNSNYGFGAKDYGVYPPGTMIQVDVTGLTADALDVSLDGTPLSAGSWYAYSNGVGLTAVVYNTWWPDGTHLLTVDAFVAGEVVAAHTFTVYMDSTASWPMDTTNVSVVTIGFPEDSAQIQQNLSYMGWGYTQYTDDPNTWQYVPMPYRYQLVQATPEYADTLLARARENATQRTDLDARLNLTALITQRDTRIPQDIFDPLAGLQLGSSWLEGYVHANPILPVSPSSFTFYLVNFDALNSATTGGSHWFVRPLKDVDTGREANWFRLEWDNALNIPMGYPMNIFGGPDHTVFIDPTAYEWYLDWTNVWWNGASERSPYGYAYDDVAPEARPAYLATFVNDLLEGLTELPWTPIVQDNVVIYNDILDGSTTHSASDLSWVEHDGPLLEYLQSFLPFKHWEMKTVIQDVSAMPQVESMVDGYTTWVDGHGYINGDAVWESLYENKSLYAPPQPDTFSILTVDFVYDDRSMVSGGREFTGLGGSGITAIFFQTGRLYDANGMPRRGLTTTIAHETGHNLGFGHQFGADYRADFVDGGMGYFREELTYGTFWEDDLYRVYDHMELDTILNQISLREPLPLSAEFRSFYSDYGAMRFLAAYEDLLHIETLLTDPVPPIAEAGPDVTTLPGTSVTLDASASTDNVRIASYTWDFGDGLTTTSSSPTVETSWSSAGVYRVTLTVTDLAGNTATDSLTVTVSAPMPPPVATITGVTDTYGILVVPGGSTASTGIVVSFTADRSADAASFLCGLDGSWSACASPAVYAGMSAGAHAFAVTPLDHSGQPGMPFAMFAWTVLTPAQATAGLIHTIQTMGWSSGTTNSLLDPLVGAYRILTDRKPYNDLKACTQLKAFIAQVDLLVAQGRLPPDQGWTLRTTALEIESALGCP